jgi:hypothetical protein
MKYKSTIKTIFIISVSILATGCKPKPIPASKGGYTHSGIYFGAHFNDNYKKGIQDGCKTSKGVYTKSHWLFQNRKDYANGWFLGRNRCKHLLKLDKNGDIVL